MSSPLSSFLPESEQRHRPASVPRDLFSGQAAIPHAHVSQTGRRARRASVAARGFAGLS
jgi:hypothetical protein